MLGSIPFYFMTLIIYITVYRAPRLTRQLNDVKEDHSRTCRAMHALVDRLPFWVNFILMIIICTVWKMTILLTWFNGVLQYIQIIAVAVGPMRKSKAALFCSSLLRSWPTWHASCPPSSSLYDG